MAQLSERIRDDGVRVVSVVGDLDLATVQQFLTVARRSTTAQTSLEVDLEGLSFIDSTGLSALLQLRKETVAHGLSLSLSNVGPSAHRLFRITGLLGLFDVGANDP